MYWAFGHVLDTATVAAELAFYMIASQKCTSASQSSSLPSSWPATLHQQNNF